MNEPTFVAVAPIRGTVVSVTVAPDVSQAILRLPLPKNAAHPVRPVGTIVLIGGEVRTDVILCLSEAR